MTGDATGRRGQASVVGVALLLAMTVVALGALTVSTGALIDQAVAGTDAQRVARTLDTGLQPVETTGHDATTVRFADGRLATVDRELRVFDAGGPVAAVDVGGLVFSSADRRVAYVGDAVLRGRGERAWAVAPPAVTASRGTGGVLVVSAARLNASHATVSGERASARLTVDVTHERRRLGRGRYRVALETAVPRALAAAFAERGATTTTRDIDGDGVPSVVATFPGRRTAYLVVHDMRLEVNDG